MSSGTLPIRPNEKGGLRAALVACDLRSYAAPWPRIRVRLFNRIRRRGRMSACPTCGLSSPRQRSNPLLGNRCLPREPGGKLQRRPRRLNRKRALPLRRKSRAAAHVAVDDRTSWKLLAPTPPSREMKHTGSRSAVTSITARAAKRAARSRELKKSAHPDAVRRGASPPARAGGAPYNAPVVVQWPHKSVLSIATIRSGEEANKRKGRPESRPGF
jgi:hypothetical protein